MAVKRYDMFVSDFGEPSEMGEYDCGDYVKFDDYESLAYEYDMLKDKYDTLVNRLGELYREG